MVAGYQSPNVASVSNHPADDPMFALLDLAEQLGGGGSRVVVPRDSSGIFIEVKRPPLTGNAYDHPLLRGISLIRLPSVRMPTDAERAVFGDIGDVAPSDAALMQEILGRHARYAARGETEKASETGRVLCRLLAREAETQMFQTCPEKALGLLVDARAFFETWKIEQIRLRRSDPVHLAHLDRLDDEWCAREESWTAITQGVKTARKQLERASAMVAGGIGPQAVHLYLASGRRYVGMAKKLREMVAPAFVHHILHHGGEEALEKAVQQARQAGMHRELEQAGHLLTEAREMHAESHWWLYCSDAWLPPISEDGRSVLRPNVIGIRGNAVSVAVFLGLPPLNYREIFDSVVDRDRLFPIETAVQELFDYRLSFEETFRQTDDITALTDLFAVALGVEGSLRHLQKEIGSLPPYLIDLYNGFLDLVAIAAAKRRQGTPSRDMSRRLSTAILRVTDKGKDLLKSRPGSPEILNDDEVGERMDLINYLMRSGQWILAHTLAVSLEEDLHGSPRLAEAKRLHDEIHERMLPEIGKGVPGGRLSELLRALLARR
jgi:hypothetical protein